MPFELEIIGVKYYHVVISCLDRTDIRLRVVSKAFQNREKRLHYYSSKKKKKDLYLVRIVSKTLQNKEKRLHFFSMFSFGHDIVEIHLRNILLSQFGLSSKEA